MKKIIYGLAALWAIVLSVIVVNAQDSCDVNVTVQRGDTLVEIAEACGTTVPAILAVNPSITDPNVLEVGDVIVLPSPANDVDPFVAISPQRGEPGIIINVIANGFPLNADVTVEIGPESGVPVTTQQTRTTNAGGLYTTLAIPITTDVDATNPRWNVVVTTLDGAFFARSFPFIITEDGPDVVLPPIEQTPQGPFTQTQVYLVNVGAAPAGTVCQEPMTPYSINIEPTIAPLTAAIESMLSTENYPGEGLYNAFSLSNLTLAGIDIDNQRATIALTGELVTLGQCDRQWMPAQIRQTALQYNTIASVEILLNGQPLEDVLENQGDA